MSEDTIPNTKCLEMDTLTVYYLMVKKKLKKVYD